MATVEKAPGSVNSELKNAITLFAATQQRPLFVQNLVEHFGNSFAEQDEVRSLVWELIAHRELILRNDLTLGVRENGTRS